MSGIFLVYALGAVLVLLVIVSAAYLEAQATADDLRAALRRASDAAAADRAEVERLGLLLVEHGVCPDLLAAQDQALALVAPVADVVPMRGES